MGSIDIESCTASTKGPTSHTDGPSLDSNSLMPNEADQLSAVTHFSPQKEIKASAGVPARLSGGLVNLHGGRGGLTSRGRGRSQQCRQSPRLCSQTTSGLRPTASGSSGQTVKRLPSNLYSPAMSCGDELDWNLSCFAWDKMCRHHCNHGRAKASKTSQPQSLSPILRITFSH
ncbi:hypothetical protein RRG08_057004 [Elysia crispata]|uniref:Uncharacterized protein n=1 Tax=Elysia crispata TaxID=231223 RepID=A0AAE0Z796_9GAST|nr:hypothetical protein RRG08_057004 [Elysia crispata]